MPKQDDKKQWRFEPDRRTVEMVKQLMHSKSALALYLFAFIVLPLSRILLRNESRAEHIGDLVGFVLAMVVCVTVVLLVNWKWKQ